MWLWAYQQIYLACGNPHLPNHSFVETSPWSYSAFLESAEVFHFSFSHVSIYATSSITFTAEETTLLMFHIGRFILQLLMYFSGFNCGQWHSFHSIHMEVFIHIYTLFSTAYWGFSFLIPTCKHLCNIINHLHSWRDHTSYISYWKIYFTAYYLSFWP